MSSPESSSDESPPLWERTESETGPHIFIGRVRYDTLANPRTGEPMRRTVMEMPDWVNILALTPERELILVRQYRFGREKVTTEIPGGVVDPGEDHGDTARRELREETGYTAEGWRYLGAVEPNPAFQNNLCHHWLAEGARLTHELELDPGEDLRVTKRPLDQVRAMVHGGEISHSLILSALARILDLSQA